MLNLIKKRINHLTKKEISYIIFTGGLAELKEFRTFAMNIFDENIKVGSIFEMGVRNNKYSSCLGLLKFYAANAEMKGKDYSRPPHTNLITKGKFMAVRMLQTDLGKAKPEYTDFKYWKANGWLDKVRPWKS